MLCFFLLYSHVNRLYVHVHPLPHEISSHLPPLPTPLGLWSLVWGRWVTQQVPISHLSYTWQCTCFRDMLSIMVHSPSRFTGGFGNQLQAFCACGLSPCLAHYHVVSRCGWLFTSCMLVNLACQCGCATGCLNTWWDIILSVSLRVLLGRSHIWINRLSKVDCPP